MMGKEDLSPPLSSVHDVTPTPLPAAIALHHAVSLGLKQLSFPSSPEFRLAVGKTNARFGSARFPPIGGLEGRYF